MHVAKEWLADHPLSKRIQVIISDEQTQGYGKPGNTWVSPKGNFYATFILPFSFSLPKLTELSFVTTIAIGETLLHIKQDLELSYKWPNDIMIVGKKVGGILLEPHDKVILLGIGINLMHAPPNLPATALRHHHILLSTMTFLETFLPFLLHWVEVWEKESFHSIRTEWLKHAFRLHQEITVNTTQKKIQGIFDGIGTDGNLILTEKNGTKWRLASGEIFIQGKE